MIAYLSSLSKRHGFVSLRLARRAFSNAAASDLAFFIAALCCSLGVVILANFSWFSHSFRSFCSFSFLCFSCSSCFFCSFSCCSFLARSASCFPCSSLAFLSSSTFFAARANVRRFLSSFAAFLFPPGLNSGVVIQRLLSARQYAYLLR